MGSILEVVMVLLGCMCRRLDGRDTSVCACCRTGRVVRSTELSKVAGRCSGEMLRRNAVESNLWV